MLQDHQLTERQSLDHPLVSPQRKQRHPALERLICAAICDGHLASLLVRTPMLALQRYEVGRYLSDAERRLVLSITDASDIHDFAGRLHALAGQSRQPSAGAAYEERSVDRPAAEPTSQRDAHTALGATTLLQL